MKKWIQKLRLQGLWKGVLLAGGLVGISLFAMFYFNAYAQPYMKQNIIDLSYGWQYTTDLDMEIRNMDVLRSIDVGVEETLHISRSLLNEKMPEATLMFKTNHQQIQVLLDDKLIFESPYHPDIKNPGMGLHFVTLPENYIGKTLQIKIVSPYTHYAGAPSSVYLGDSSSLHAYAVSKSMPHTLLMVLCIAAGIFTMGLAILRIRHSDTGWGDFCFGVFSILWGFYYPSTDYIVHQFFNPQWVSYISIGLYFLYPLPLMLYFYFHFTKWQKAFLPVVVARALFIGSAFVLQVFGIMDFPEMLGVNNPLYVISSLYMMILACLEIKQGNRFVRFTIPWVMLAFVISMHSLVMFYTTRIKQDESLYGAAFFMLIIVVWAYNLKEFFIQRVKEKNDLQVLQLKNQLAIESYESMKNHLEQVGFIRHEMKNHVVAMQILMDNKEYGKMQRYLTKMSIQNEKVPQVVYCEHYLINAILNSRISKACGMGVRVNPNIALPKQLKISDEDLCSLLMNIFDNALEAVAEVALDANRWIDIKMHMQKPYLYISCSNTKSGPVLVQEGEIVSTKGDKENHGYGLRIIRRIVEKGEGIMNISYTKDTFTIETAIKIGAD